MKLPTHRFSIKKAICCLSLAIAVSGCSVNTPQEEGVSKVNEQELIPIESLFNESAIRGVKLSTDGQWLAWLQQHNGAANIYVMPSDGTLKDAFPLTAFADGVDGFYWDIHQLAMLVSKDTNGNEQHQIYRLDLENEAGKLNLLDTKKLTSKEEVNYEVVGQASEKVDALTLYANHDDPKVLNYYQLDTKTGELTLLLSNTYGFREALIDSDGIPVAGVASNPDTSVEMFIRKDNTWQRVLKSEPGEILNLSSYNPELGSLYFESSVGEADTSGLNRLDLDTGKITRIHTDPNQRSDLYKTLFNKDGELQLVSYYYGYREDYPVEKDFQEHWQHIADHFSSRVEVDVVSMNEQAGVWLLSIGSDVDPGAYYTYHLEDQSLVRLLDKDAELAAQDLSERRSITYTARDGITIQAYLTLPKNKGEQLPLVVIPHGGPWGRDYWKLGGSFFNPVAQLLANRGYAVLQPNFRASIGFGETFIAKGDRQWGAGAMQHDLTDGVEYLIEQGIADKDKVAIFGASYGGYAALSGLTFTPDVYAAAISFVGPSSLITMTESFPEYYRPYIPFVFNAVGDPLIEADREDMESRSPLNYTDRIQAPLLLVQGANDPRVTQVESDQIARAMYQKGLDVEYILAKDEGHGFSKNINRMAFLIKMEAFFAEHLGGEIGARGVGEVCQALGRA
uniref:Peptidase S9 prolyl oligopeptidase n=1 Tax=gamma proteobacterium D250 TaxID=649546 RepID=M4HXD1_9GAMM|nr:peptidase S9 prolyl oligopeptidase [gamma proteobacterium D250]